MKRRYVNSRVLPASDPYLNAKRAEAAARTNFDIDIHSPDVWEYFVARALRTQTVPIIMLAERWAALMQIEHAAGSAIPEIATGTLELANLERLTPFQCDTARQILALCWVHGEALECLKLSFQYPRPSP